MTSSEGSIGYETKPVLIMSVWCTCYASVIIFFRFSGRWRRTAQVWIEDVIVLLSIVVLVTRMGLVSFVLKYGTNNVDLNSLQGEEDVRRRETGSQLVLVCRIMYLTFLWMAKLSVAIYIARLTNQFWASKSLTSSTSGGRVIKAFLSRYLNHIFLTFLGVSYIAVVLSEAIECRPFYRYWQVTPAPDFRCRLAPGNLLTMGIFNILTDLTLAALPLPMILSAKIRTKLKVETIVLTLLPLLNVAFTCYRITIINANGGSQLYRTLLASFDMLISTSAANTLVVIAFLKDRGFKKLKYRNREGEEAEPVEPVSVSGVELGAMDSAKSLNSARPFSPPTGPLQSPPRERLPTWESDEDLMRDDSDGGPSTHTTSVRDAGNAGNEGCTASRQGGLTVLMNGTGHLSPNSKAETSIVASHSTEVISRREDAVGSASPAPSRSSLHTGIVVETSWKVDISQK